MPQRRSIDGKPHASASGSATVREWLSLLLPPLTILGVVVAFWMIWQAALVPAPLVSGSPMMRARDSFASPSAATFPPEVVSMAVAISTFIAPTPTPTATPYQTPTPLSVTVWCGINSQTGQSCEWPFPTTVATELPTPLPVCITPMPLSDCVWMN